VTNIEIKKYKANVYLGSKLKGVEEATANKLIAMAMTT
jgi:hypothetical protein